MGTKRILEGANPHFTQGKPPFHTLLRGRVAKGGLSGEFCGFSGEFCDTGFAELGGMTPKLKEKDITKQIRDLLHRVGILHWKQFQTLGSRPGISDIVGATAQGKLLCIEVKKPGGRLSEHQQKFLEEVRAHGGVAFVATSPEDVIRELNLNVKLYPLFGGRSAVRH